MLDEAESPLLLNAQRLAPRKSSLKPAIRFLSIVLCLASVVFTAWAGYNIVHVSQYDIGVSTFPAGLIAAFAVLHATSRRAAAHAAPVAVFCIILATAVIVMGYMLPGVKSAFYAPTRYIIACSVWVVGLSVLGLLVALDAARAIRAGADKERYAAGSASSAASGDASGACGGAAVARALVFVCGGAALCGGVVFDALAAHVQLSRLQGSGHFDVGLLAWPFVEVAGGNAMLLALAAAPSRAARLAASALAALGALCVAAAYVYGFHAVGKDHNILSGLKSHIGWLVAGSAFVALQVVIAIAAQFVRRRRASKAPAMTRF